jgi:hypothetical protein
MLRALIILAASQLRSPVLAGRVMVALLGMHPEVAEDLERVCHRESRCQPEVGVHERDAHLSESAYWGQVKLGQRELEQGRWTHLHRECQPYGDGDWATRGPFGLSASAHWAYVWPCYSPAIFDSVWLSAWVAARKHDKVCGAGCDSAVWCPEARTSRCRKRRAR